MHYSPCKIPLRHGIINLQRIRMPPRGEKLFSACFSASNVTFKPTPVDDGDRDGNDGTAEFPLATRATSPETGRNFAPAERVKSLPRETLLSLLPEAEKRRYSRFLGQLRRPGSAKLSKRR